MTQKAQGVSFSHLLAMAWFSSWLGHEVCSLLFAEGVTRPTSCFFSLHICVWGFSWKSWCQITSCAPWSDKEECCWTGNHFLNDAFWRLFALNSGRPYVMSKQNFGWTHLDNVYVLFSKISCAYSQLGFALPKKFLNITKLKCSLSTQSYFRMCNQEILSKFV